MGFLCGMFGPVYNTSKRLERNECLAFLYFSHVPPQGLYVKVVLWEPVQPQCCLEFSWCFLRILSSAMNLRSTEYWAVAQYTFINMSPHSSYSWQYPNTFTKIGYTCSTINLGIDWSPKLYIDPPASCFTSPSPSSSFNYYPMHMIIYHPKAKKSDLQDGIFYLSFCWLKNSHISLLAMVSVAMLWWMILLVLFFVSWHMSSTAAQEQLPSNFEAWCFRLSSTCTRSCMHPYKGRFGSLRWWGIWDSVWKPSFWHGSSPPIGCGWVEFKVYSSPVLSKDIYVVCAHLSSCR